MDLEVMRGGGEEMGGIENRKNNHDILHEQEIYFQ